MSEHLLLRFQGGPHDGSTKVTDRLTWPLPDFLVLKEEGTYVKVSESSLPEPRPGVVRGALYEWKAHP